MNAKKYYNAELTPEKAEALKVFLKDNNIYFEPSACYNLIHFEVLATPEELQKINAFLETI